MTQFAKIYLRRLRVARPKAERFIYLNWATTNGKVLTAMVGRIKLHLNHIEWAAVPIP
jgi:hypothetical protein